MISILQEDPSALLLIMGSLFFLLAAFMPISRVFGERVAEGKIAIIQAERSRWRVSQLFFALGSFIAWVGMILLAYQIKIANGSAFSLVSAAAAGVGMLLWCRHVFLRAKQPEAFARGLLPGWHFKVYSYLTSLALLGIGVGLLALEILVWLPVLNISSALLFFLVFLIFKDLPPLFYYLVMLIDGIALLILMPF